MYEDFWERLMAIVWLEDTQFMRIICEGNILS